MTIGGFNQDRREIWDIPEVQTYCQCLVDIGFIAYLGETGSV
jgi:hypothetical protein